MCIIGDIIENILIGKVTVATKPSEFNPLEIWSIRHINTLPRELLLSVFRFLKPSDLKQVVLVCKHWKDIGEEPVLWKNFKLVVANKKISIVDEILNSKRFLCLQQLEINGFGYGDAKREIDSSTLGVILQSPVQKLGLKNCDLSLVSKEDVEMLIGGLKSLTLWNSHLTSSQTVDMFQCLSRSKDLFDLDIGYSYLDLSMVSPEMFSKALVKRRNVNLGFTRLTRDQIIRLFDVISKKTTIKTLDVGYRDLSFLDPDTLKLALKKLANVNICPNKFITTPYIFSTKLIKV